MKTAFLTGYTGKPTRTPTQLQQLAINLDAVVVDSRFSPRSRVPHWGYDQLKRFLAPRYMWIREFGNQAYREGYIKLYKPEHGLYVLEQHPDQRFIILCACSDGTTCHRRQVGEYLAAHGWTVREVTADEWKDAAK